MFKLKMFKLDKIELHKKEFIEYNGHLPYYILAVLGRDDVRKRNEYLKKINLYESEIKKLKLERKQDEMKLAELKNFLSNNPKFRDIVNYEKLLKL